MRKITFYVAILAVIASGINSAHAFDPPGQTYESATASITASVAAELKLTKNEDVHFGTISQNQTAVLDPYPEAQHNYVGSNPTVGSFTIQGDSKVLVYFPENVELDNDGSTITYVTSMVGNTENNNNTRTPITSGNDITPSNGFYFLWLGGSIEVPSDVAAGEYTGEITVSVEYE